MTTIWSPCVNYFTKWFIMKVILLKVEDSHSSTE